MGFESERIDKALNDFICVTELRPLEPKIKETLAAEKLNIPITGLAGILLSAKEKGFLKSIGSLIDELRNQGYWISDKVVDITKHLSGEK